MPKRLLLALALLPLTAHGQPMVGGRCEYETLIGTARFVEVLDGEKHFSFEPASPILNTARVHVDSGMSFHARRLTDDLRKDTAFPARLEIITEGSCTPYRFVLLSSEHFSHDIFLRFDEDGRVPATTRERIQAIGRIYQRISDHWPKLTIELLGQTARTRTREYDRTLARHYEYLLGQQLQTLDVPTGKLTYRPDEDQECGDPFRNTDQDGVWLRFNLTGTAPITRPDAPRQQQPH